MRNAEQNTDFMRDYKYSELLVWYVGGQHTILELMLVCLLLLLCMEYKHLLKET